MPRQQQQETIREEAQATLKKLERRATGEAHFRRVQAKPVQRDASGEKLSRIARAVDRPLNSLWAALSTGRQRSARRSRA